MKFIICLTCYWMFFFVGSGYCTSPTIDSLEAYSKIAKPGWDQIDVTLGLARLYLNAGELENSRKKISDLQQMSEQFEIEEAKALAMIMQSIIAYSFEDNAKKAVSLCEEALEIAKKTGSNDTFVYASFMLAQNYIWEIGDVNKGKSILTALLDKLDASVTSKNAGNVHKDLGVAHFQLGEYDEALVHLKTAYSIFEAMRIQPPIDPRIGRVSVLATDPEYHLTNVLDELGNLYMSMGQSALAVQNKLKALDLVEKSGTLIDIAWMNTNMGSIYLNLSDFQKSLSHLQTARKIYEKLDHKADIAKCNSSMITVFTHLKEYSKAEQYAIENLNYFEETGNSFYYTRAQLQAIETFLAKDDLDQAKKLLSEAEIMVDSLGNKPMEAWFLLTKGLYSKLRNDLDNAAVLVQKSRSLYAILDKPGDIAVCELKIAEIFFAKHAYDSAEYYVNESLQKVNSSRNVLLARGGYSLLSKIYEGKGDYKKAYENHRTFFAFNDSVYTSGAQAMLKEEQVRQDVVGYQNEKELAEQNALLLENQNRLYLLGGIVLMVILALMAYLYSNLRKVKAKIERQNEQLTQLNQTKNKFFGIIAHDLRSPLLGLQTVGDQINYFIKMGQANKLEELSGHIGNTTKKLTELLDNLLNWALLQNGMIPYHPEKIDMNQAINAVIELLSSLADMKEVELVNDLNEPSYVYADGKAVQTILRNIISNAVKFTDKGGKVSVNVNSEEEHAFITINDTGTGISAEQLPKIFDLDKSSVEGTKGEKGTGLGLVLCKELIELNKGSIKVESHPGQGSTFRFKLPKYSEAA